MKTKQEVPSTLTAAVIAVQALLWSAGAEAARVTSIDFKASGGSSEIEITSDAPLNYEKQENSLDRQVVLELKGAQLSRGARRKLDTSSFKSNVSLVSPYQVNGQSDTSRVVIQLRQAAKTKVAQAGNVLKITIPMGAAPGDAPAAESPVAEASPLTSDAPSDAPPTTTATQDLNSTSSAPGADPTAPAPPGAESPPVGATSVDTQPKESASVSVVKTPKDNKGIAETKDSKNALGEFIDSKATKRYIGKPVTLQFRDADILDVFQLIGEASGFNVIVGDDVKGKITLSLVDIPWDQALDLVLTTRQLGAERNNNVLRILTLSNLTQEKTAELQAKKAAEASAPRITRVFPISYAKLGDLTTVFQKFGSGTGEAAATLVQADERTNSIIVRDTSENIDRIKKLIEILDTQTPQVLIEARVIEAGEKFSKSINGTIGVGKNKLGGNNFVAAFNGNDPNESLTTLPLGLTNGGTIGISPVLGFLGIERLNAFLNISQKDNKLKVIGSPRLVVLNKESATILASTPVVIQNTGVTTGGTSISTPMNANLSLNVKPTVTNDGGVLMDLQISKDVPQTNGVAQRNITTKVLVESGNTLVIGGIYTQFTEDASTGFPFLRRLPILGWLFGSEATSDERTELFIFITPRILNEKEAGLSG